MLPMSDPMEEPELLRQAAALVEAADDPVIGLTLGGVITYWNRAAEWTYGYSAEEAVGQSIVLLIPPELRHAPGGLLPAVRGGHSIRQHETQRMAKDGRRIDVSISMSPIRDRSGNVVAAAAFTRDISARKRDEEKLRTSASSSA